MKLFLDLHVIQTVPPSCLNRDDTGSPKTAVYGGVRRARVSSQAWKKAMRTMFKEHLDEGELSYRTFKIFDLVAAEIKKLSPGHSDEDALALAKKVFEKAKVKPSSKDAGKSDALFFISGQQAKNLAALAIGDLEGKEAEKAVIQELKNRNGIEVALFGRMVASNPEINCDASAQVAHAISTHKIENEYDYFTAVDDCSKEDHAGAGMIGTVEYNAATLYRYANIAVHELFSQLTNDTAALEKAIREFIRAFVLSIPTGKQNTFAAHTFPHAVMVALRTDRPLNLADAFESPIISNEGYAAKSALAFAKHAQAAYECFCASPTSSYVIGSLPEELGRKTNMDDLISRAASEAVGMVQERVQA